MVKGEGEAEDGKDSPSLRRVWTVSWSRRGWVTRMGGANIKQS